MTKRIYHGDTVGHAVKNYDTIERMHSDNSCLDIYATSGNICSNEIVCPYCGYAYSDSYEYLDHPHKSVIPDFKCDGCFRKFRVDIEYSVSYITEKA